MPAGTLDPMEIHRRAVVVDAQSHIPTDVTYRRRRGERGVFQARHLPLLRSGGVDVVFAAAFIEAEHKPERAQKRAMQMLGAVLADLDETTGGVQLIRRRGDLERVVDEGLIGLVLGIEGGEAVEDHLESMRSFYEVGVRFLGLTWNQRNRLADGKDEEGSNGGLTRAGIDVVREANRLGIVIDISHISQAGFWAVLEASNAPIMVSHASSRELHDHPRNLTDRQVKAVAEQGGVVGVSFVGVHLSESRPTVETIADHIEHMVQLVGARHVGIGPDFVSYLYEIGIPPQQPGGDHPLGMEDASKLPNLTRVLLQRGFSVEDLNQVLGGSFVRLLGEVLR